ncbi:glycoside hydrolase family 3 N-terminal domain-containing protein [Clostridium perfringens]|uniref:glycoside hydrolase family 3 protein n=1 Tax=Clostridium perfringens TaxID=1502 RepID=UPI0039E987CF
MGVRSISSNPELVGKLGKNIAKGIQDQGVAATAKHFPGHGDTATDSHYGLPMVDKSIEELRETELKPFKIAIENGIDMIMTAHIQFPQIEKDTFISKKDGSQISIPATLSDDIIKGILREEMEYDGVVITDAMNMKAISDHFGELESTKMAINAGIDIILMPTILRNNEDVKKLDYIVNGILDSIKSGEIKEEEITDSAERIVKLKIDRGIIDLKNNNASLEEKIKKAKKTVGSVENRNIERRISEEAITITKNEENILPLNPKEGEKVLLIAPNESQIHSMKFGINRLIHENSLNNIKLDTYEYNNIGIINDVLKEKIESSDYIIVASLSSNANHLKPGAWNRDLPRSVIDYGNKLNKDTVLISLRNPYDLAAYDNAKAQVVAYGFKGTDPTEGDTLFPTKSSGPNIPASMGVVFGAVEPKGKLPVDIPSLNNDGTMNIEVNYYDYGHGITNINSLGNVNISMDKKINLGDNFQVKFNLSDFNEIVAGKYRAKIKFQGEKLEFVNGKVEFSGDLQTNIIDNNTLEVLINLEEGSLKANEMNFILEFKAIDKAELTSIEITSSELIDAKGRSFNQKYVISEFSIEDNKEDKPLSPDEDKEDEENNEDLGNSDNNEEELPQTGSNFGKEFIFGLGSLSLLAGIGLKSKRFKRK